MGYYKEAFAHSGASIGVNNSESKEIYHGEVPLDFPTILQQVDLVTGLIDFTDLII